MEPQPNRSNSPIATRSFPSPPPLGEGSAPRTPLRDPPPHPFEAEFNAIEGPVSVIRLVDAALKRPARVVFEISRGRAARALAGLFAVAAACMLAYGFVMGLFSGGAQLWIVPLKVSLGLLFSGLICLPSLYIFSCLSGGQQSLREAAGLLLLFLGLNAILLLGFAPIAWVFSQSTDTVAFMGFMHLLFWLTGTLLSVRVFRNAFEFLNRRRMLILRLWSIIFVLVVLQMSTTLRPLVGEFKGYGLEQKTFFLKHWLETLD